MKKARTRTIGVCTRSAFSMAREGRGALVLLTKKPGLKHVVCFLSVTQSLKTLALYFAGYLKPASTCYSASCSASPDAQRWYQLGRCPFEPSLGARGACVMASGLCCRWEAANPSSSNQHLPRWVGYCWCRVLASIEPFEAQALQQASQADSNHEHQHARMSIARQ